MHCYSRPRLIDKRLRIDNILLSDNLVILGHFHLPSDKTCGLYKRRKKHTQANFDQICTNRQSNATLVLHERKNVFLI